MLREERGIADQRALPGMEEWLRPRTQGFLDDWDRAAERERASRSLFAQHSIKVDEVATEVSAVREAIGGALDVEAFVRAAVPAHGGLVRDRNGSIELDLSDAAPR